MGFLGLGRYLFRAQGTHFTERSHYWHHNGGPCWMYVSSLKQVIGDSSDTTGSTPPVDRAAVYEIVTDILRHGIFRYVISTSGRAACALSVHPAQSTTEILMHLPRGQNTYRVYWETSSATRDNVPMKGQLTGSRCWVQVPLSYLIYLSRSSDSYNP